MNSDHWSFSQLRTYLRCPLQHFFRYTLHLPERSVSSALAVGSAVHQALAVYHEAMQHEHAISADEVKEAFRDAWEERKARALVLFQRVGEHDAIHQAISLLDTYLRQPMPRNIVAVEQELLTPLVTSAGEVLDKPLVTILDLVTRDEDGVVVTDFKTSGKAYSDYDARLSHQPTAYLYAAQHHYGETAVFQYQVMIKTQKPRLQTLATARMPTDFDRFADLVQAVDQAVAGGICYPVESPLNCSSCAYRKPCREWQSDHTLSLSGRMPLAVVEGNGCVD